IGVIIALIAQLVSLGNTAVTGDSILPITLFPVFRIVYPGVIAVIFPGVIAVIVTSVVVLFLLSLVLHLSTAFLQALDVTVQFPRCVPLLVAFLFYLVYLGLIHGRLSGDNHPALGAVPVHRGSGGFGY